jgi:hypothetical protein
MEASVDPIPVEAPAAPVDPVAAAVATLDALEGPGANLSTPYDPNADLPPVKFDRYSLERRVLGTVNDEEELTALGARNTLATVSHSLINDRNVTHPRAPMVEALDISGGSAAAIGIVYEKLTALVDADLLDLEDGIYHKTDAGNAELAV